MDKRHDSAERPGTRPDVDGTHQAALLIDFDNVTMGIRSNLGQELRNLLNSHVIRGKVAVQRAYADWRRYPQYIVPLSEASIDLIFAPAYGSSKKNATDIRLAIDALELVFVRPEIRTFILMSGDSDFSSLVLKLKEYGKYVIGVGIQESSSDLLVQNCDEYYSYSALTGLSKSGDQPVESHDPWVLIQKAVEKMVERGDTMRSDRLKQVMIEVDPSFNEKEQGFNKFNRFVVEAASRGLVSIQKMENGQYGVAPASKGAKAVAQDEKPEKKEPRARRAADRRPKELRPEAAEEKEQTRRARPKLTMQSALALLRQALDALLEGKADTVRDSDVKRKLLELDPGFDEGELGFSKFSKFLKAAEEQGAIALSRGPNGNFRVAFSKGRARRGRAVTAQAPEPEPREKLAEGTMQRLARFLFGERKPEAEAVPPEPPQAEAEKPAAGERPRRREPPAARAKKGDRPARGPGEAAAPARAGQEPRASDRAPRREAAGRGERGRRGEQRAGAGRGKERRHRAEKRRPAEAERAERPRERKERVPEPSGPRAESERAPEPPPAGAAIAEARPEAPQVRSTGEAAAPEREKAAGVDAARAAERERAVGVDAAPAADREQPSGTDVAPAPLPGAPRGTIRGRWGTRGRYRPAEAPPPIFEGQKVVHRDDEAEEPTEAVEVGSGDEAVERRDSARSALDAVPETPVTSGPHAALVGRLTGYAGVGRKTAESLVEAFGADVFRVLDQEPERVREILPDHRAERVLEERRKELSPGTE